MGVAEYAAAVGYSPPQISNILNDKQPGSIKAVEACARHAGLTIFDCLALPDESPETRDEKKLVRLFRALSDGRRVLALDVLAAMGEGPRRNK